MFCFLETSDQCIDSVNGHKIKQTWFKMSRQNVDFSFFYTRLKFVVSLKKSDGILTTLYRL